MDGIYLIDFMVSLIGACIFGAITKAINTKNGYEGGFWWGFFLGVIGIIVVALRQPYPTSYVSSGNSLYFPEKSAQTPIDKDAPVPEGGWRCICGRAHKPYVSSCACGRAKHSTLDATATSTRFLPPQKPTPPAHKPQGWSCPCGREHPSYETSCICGKTKQEVLTANIHLPDSSPDLISEEVPAPADDPIIQSLRKYKSLLDDGVITQEDYDAKKKQLLGL